MTVRHTAQCAYRLAEELVSQLEQGRFDEFEDYFARLEENCTLLLRTPLSEFDDETAALAGQLAVLQRRICDELDALMAEAAGAMSANKQGRQVLRAYGSDASPSRLPRAV